MKTAGNPLEYDFDKVDPPYKRNLYCPKLRKNEFLLEIKKVNCDINKIINTLTLLLPETTLNEERREIQEAIDYLTFALKKLGCEE